MRSGEKYDGIWPVLVTPLLNGEIDRLSLARLVRWLEGYDIGGFWTLGTGSEDHHLTLDQRIDVADIVTQTAKKPVILGCSFFSLQETKTFIGETRHMPFEAYHWTPYQRLISQDQILRNFSKVVNEKVWAYTSANFSQHITPSRWKREGAVGLKFSSQRTSHLQEAISEETEDFKVMTAVASQTRICRLMGSKRHTSSLASAMPELCIAAWEGDQEPLSRFTRCFAARKDNFVSAAEEKAILAARGIIASHEVTEGYRPCTPEERASIDANVTSALAHHVDPAATGANVPVTVATIDAMIP